MTAPASVRVSTFWISLAFTVLLAAVGNYVLISNKLSILETQVANYQTQLINTIERVDSLQNQIVTRTDDRFRRGDWEREEAQINAKFATMQAEMARKFDRIEEKLNVIVTRLVEGTSK